MPKPQSKLVTPEKPLELTATAVFEIAASDGSGEGDALPKFTMVAYTGGQLSQPWAPYPIVVDLESAEIPDKDIPALYAHDNMRIVGHGRGSKSAKQITFKGIISGVGPDAQEVRSTSKNGFPWQASVRGPIPELAFVERGNSVKVNGKTFQGPVYVARRFSLREVSFCSLGEDGASSVAVAASANNGAREMNFEQWLAAKGFGDGLTEDQKKVLKSAFDAEQQAQTPASEGTGGTAAAAGNQNLQASQGGGTAPVGTLPSATDYVAEIRARAAAEQARITQINQACSGNPEIQAQAISEGWTPEKAELAVLRASRPNVPSIHVPNHQATPQVLTAALCLAGKLEGTEKAFSDQTLQAAHTQFRRGLGLQELLLICAWEGGFSGHTVRPGNLKEVLRAAFSTTSLPGILADTANKFLIEGYQFVEQVWRMIARIRPVNDFKSVTSHQMISGGRFRKVGASGELSHGQLTDQTYSNKADTYGEILTITRQDYINDDLDALSGRPKMVGRDAGLELNNVFWALFINNSTFFTTGRGNYAEGAGTALSIDALTQAEQLFMDQTGADGKPLGLTPKVLLVPTGKGAVASTLMKSAEVRDTTANTKFGVANPHAGKFEVGISRYLGNASYTGYSQKAFYLAADPNDEAAIEVAFLNGQEEPTIETADADFDTLGTKLRGYFDFGVAMREYRAAVKLKGEA